MTLSELATLLSCIDGFRDRVAYRAFRVGHAPALPYIIYIQTGSRNYYADCKVLLKRKNINIELYTKIKDESAESRVEQALAAADIIWVKMEDYIDSERCYMITYSITI